MPNIATITLDLYIKKITPTDSLLAQLRSYFSNNCDTILNASQLFLIGVE
jgi:hypothetical protein